MSEKPQKSEATDYSKTLFLPQTEFPMRAGLPQREPEILKRWNEIGLYRRLARAAAGRRKFVLHDGPPMPTATSISARPQTRSSRIS